MVSILYQIQAETNQMDHNTITSDLAVMIFIKNTDADDYTNIRLVCKFLWNELRQLYLLVNQSPPDTLLHIINKTHDEHLLEIVLRYKGFDIFSISDCDTLIESYDKFIKDTYNEWCNMLCEFEMIYESQLTIFCEPLDIPKTLSRKWWNTS